MDRSCPHKFTWDDYRVALSALCFTPRGLAYIRSLDDVLVKHVQPGEVCPSQACIGSSVVGLDGWVSGCQVNNAAIYPVGLGSATSDSVTGLGRHFT